MSLRLPLDARFFPDPIASGWPTRENLRHRLVQDEGRGWSLVVDDVLGGPHAHDAPFDCLEAAVEARSSRSRALPGAALGALREGDDLGDGIVLVEVPRLCDAGLRWALRTGEGVRVEVHVFRRVGEALGPASTVDLDFVLHNDGGGRRPTDERVARALRRLALRLEAPEAVVARRVVVAHLPPHPARRATSSTGPVPAASAVPPMPNHAIEGETSRLTLTPDSDPTPTFAAVLQLRRRAMLTWEVLDDGNLELRLAPRGESASGSVPSFDEVLRSALAEGAAAVGSLDASIERLVTDGLLDRIRAADSATFGVGAEPPAQPSHAAMRVFHLRGAAACDSDCLFCVEKFEPSHSAMPTTDEARAWIVEGARSHDVLHFASGEPTLHPRLFEHAELARSLGYRALGMSSHFRRMGDPAFTLRLLRAGFRYFDVSLHAAEAAAQARINPIGDEGRSLVEALHGVAVLHRLAVELGIGVHVTHKVVLSRENLTDLAAIVSLTYERGVRSFLVQPVHVEGLDDERVRRLDLAGADVRTVLASLAAHVASLPGASLKPYGFSRLDLPTGAHVVTETNRVKNVYGRFRAGGRMAELPALLDPRPVDGRPYVAMASGGDRRFGIVAGGERPILDEALARGLRLKHGCRMGSCGMCAARLVHGQVDPGDPFFLDANQRAEGYVLLCQARPLGDVELVLCDEDEIARL